MSFYVKMHEKIVEVENVVEVLAAGIQEVVQHRPKLEIQEIVCEVPEAYVLALHEEYLPAICSCCMTIATEPLTVKCAVCQREPGRASEIQPSDLAAKPPPRPRCRPCPPQ